MQSEVLELIHLVTRMASLSQEFFILTGWSSPEPESYLATTLLYLKVCKATRTGYVLSSNWNTIMPRRWFATTALAYSGPLPNLFQTRTTTPIYCSLSLGTTKTLGNLATRDSFLSVVEKCVLRKSMRKHSRIVDASTFRSHHGASAVTQLPGFCPSSVPEQFGRFFSFTFLF